MSIYIVSTRDGSPTLFSERYQQHYHNMSGALTESRHVFFEHTGIIEALTAHHDFAIFEIGFGTGLNLLLLEWLHRETGSHSRVEYYSVEKYPVSTNFIKQMGFDEIFSRDSLKPRDTAMSEAANRDQLFAQGLSTEKLINIADELSMAKPGTAIQNNFPFITVRIFRGDFYDWELLTVSPIRFFLFDAFSPEANPELWLPAIFAKLLKIADKQAVLSTYCSATRARAAMVLAGWHVARIKGPWGKREMTLASPAEEPLENYKRVNENRLRERFYDAW